MINKGIKVDNVQYEHVHIVSLKRDGEVLDGENAKRAISGVMIRDVIGTYYNYTVSIEADQASLVEYDTLYEVLSAPVASHVIEIPYAQTVMNFKAYVTKVSDEVKSISENGTRWGGMSFKFVAMSPQRR